MVFNLGSVFYSIFGKDAENNLIEDFFRYPFFFSSSIDIQPWHFTVPAMPFSPSPLVEIRNPHKSLRSQHIWSVAG